jgi:hypothetical protein
MKIQPGDPPSRLLDIPEKQFASLVETEVKGRLDPTIAEKLRDPVVAARWYNTLVGMKMTAEGVIHARRLESKAKRRELLLESETALGDDEAIRLRHLAETELIDFERWLVNTTRFLTSVEERLTSARGFMQQADPYERVQELEAAILQHAEKIDPDDASPDDQKLWSHVTGQAP